MKHLVSMSLILVGIIHLIPLSGVLSAEKLYSLYGIVFDEPNLEILMRHRAVLFGILGSFLVLAAFKPAYQLAGLVTGFVSVISFIYLALTVGDYNEHIARVFWADIVALVLLVVGYIGYVVIQQRA